MKEHARTRIITPHNRTHFSFFWQQEFILDTLNGGNTLSGTNGREDGDGRFSLKEKHRGHTGVAHSACTHQLWETGLCTQPESIN